MNAAYYPGSKTGFMNTDRNYYCSSFQGAKEFLFIKALLIIEQVLSGL